MHTALVTSTSCMARAPAPPTHTRAGAVTRPLHASQPHGAPRVRPHAPASPQPPAAPGAGGVTHAGPGHALGLFRVVHFSVLHTVGEEGYTGDTQYTGAFFISMYGASEPKARARSILQKPATAAAKYCIARPNNARPATRCPPAQAKATRLALFLSQLADPGALMPTMFGGAGQRAEQACMAAFRLGGQGVRQARASMAQNLVPLLTLAMGGRTRKRQRTAAADDGQE